MMKSAEEGMATTDPTLCTGRLSGASFARARWVLVPRKSLGDFWAIQSEVGLAGTLVQTRWRLSSWIIANP